MRFNSLVFVVFLCVVLAVTRLRVPWRWRKAFLLIASYAFYAAWNPPFVALIWISTAVDWWVARRLAREQRSGVRRALLILSLSTNLGLLAGFKYGSFLILNWVRLCALVGVEWTGLDPGISLVLPVGISFYTFQTLSYTIDVYRRRLEPASSMLDFALFVTFFPQLVAGPIVRASTFLPQCVEERRPSPAQTGWGFALLVLGLFGKVVVADSVFAPTSDAAFSAPAIGPADAWAGAFAFAGQIYFDFAGYSTCAIGVALLLGFALPDNFRYPYAALGFSDFWRRWHITLSTWLRDYLYISLGGSRRGSLLTYRNLMVTMLLGGLWHGAYWHFVAWGGLHGLFLVVQRLVERASGRRLFDVGGIARIPIALGTFALVCVAWVFFRAPDFYSAVDYSLAMLWVAPPSSVVSDRDVAIVTVATAAMLCWQWYMRDRTLESLWTRLPAWARVAVLVAVLTLVALAPGDDRAFIYFQF